MDKDTFVINDFDGRHKDRNRNICEAYLLGSTTKQMVDRFKVKRQRILQILKAGGVWQKKKSDRTEFLGIRVKAQTKEGLEAIRDEKGGSVAQHAAEMLDDAVAEVRK